jgi:hypothetical protein
MQQRIKPVLVVVGFAEALSAPEVVWSLVDAGFTVVAFSRRGRRPALRHSRHVELFEIAAPEIDHAASRRELADRLRAIPAAAQVDRVLLPLDDTALWLCAQVDARGWVLAGAHGTTAALALDKRRQTELARQTGFNVPATTFALAPTDLAPGRTTLPVILRPANAVSADPTGLYKGRNWICSDEQEFRAAAAAWKGHGVLLIQPFIQGTGEGVFGFAAKTGIVAWSAHRRLRMMNPHGSGSSACISQPVPVEVRSCIEQFVRTSQWRGLFMIELLRDSDGKLWFVEFNGRPWGSMALSRRQGLEYPAWSVRLALDPDFVPTASAPAHPLICRNLGREIMHAIFVVRGRRSRALQQWPSVGRTIFDLCRINRRSFFYNWRPDDWRVFYRDCWATIRDQLFKAG